MGRILISKLKWDYFVTLVFVITTGSIVWAQNVPSLCFIFYLIVAIANIYITGKEVKFKINSSLIYLVGIILIALISSFLIECKYGDNSLLGYLVSMIASYLIISNYDFYYFRNLLLNVVYYISIIGILTFILCELNLLPLSVFVSKSGGAHVMFLCYHFGWPTMFHRYAGIWHEPGACQIIYNSILLLYINNILKWRWRKSELKRILVIVVSLLLTFSTTGYLVFIILMSFCAYRIKLKGKYRRILKPAVLIGALVLSFLMFNSPTVHEKLFSDVNNTSKAARTLETVSMYEMFIEKPICGWGLGSHSQLIQFEKNGNLGCSNGIIYMLSSWGIVWLLLFVLALFISIRKYVNNSLVAFVVMALFLMLFSSERYLEYPFAFLFLFVFKSYNHIVYVKNQYSNRLL